MNYLFIVLGFILIGIGLWLPLQRKQPENHVYTETIYYINDERVSEELFNLVKGE